MIVSEAWDYGRSRLHSSPTPQLDARLLLEHALDASHSLAHDELARWLLSDPAAIPAMKAMIDDLS